MPLISRRGLLKGSLATSITSVAGVSLWGDPLHQASSDAISGGNTAHATATEAGDRERLLMGFGWKFQLGDACDNSHDFDFGHSANSGTYAKSGNAGPVTTLKFDDSVWRSIDVPHDWAVELPFDFDKDFVSSGGKPLSRHRPATSIGWYRRRFDIAASDESRRIRIEFDGVFRDATIFLNGQRLGENFSGYAPFIFDITDLLNHGAANILVVRVDATLHEGWFYEGAGIYRHVWLTKTAGIHFFHGGTYVRSDVSRRSAKLTVGTELQNELDQTVVCRVRGSVPDDNGKLVAEFRSVDITVTPGTIAPATMTCTMKQPKIWSLNDPHTHKLTVWLESDGQRLDHDEVNFGIRTIRFDANKGFFSMRNTSRSRNLQSPGSRWRRHRNT